MTDKYSTSITFLNILITTSSKFNRQHAPHQPQDLINFNKIDQTKIEHQPKVEYDPFSNISHEDLLKIQGRANKNVENQQTHEFSNNEGVYQYNNQNPNNQHYDVTTNNNQATNNTHNFDDFF